MPYFNILCNNLEITKFNSTTNCFHFPTTSVSCWYDFNFIYFSMVNFWARINKNKNFTRTHTRNIIISQPVFTVPHTTTSITNRMKWVFFAQNDRIQYCIAKRKRFTHTTSIARISFLYEISIDVFGGCVRLHTLIIRLIYGVVLNEKQMKKKNSANDQCRW